MGGMFRNATSFNQDIGAWQLEIVKTARVIIDIGGSGVKDVLILGVPEVNISFVLPLACFFYIACFGFGVFKNKFI
tara:strand:+ start:90 stop:317 length:228 start_codon:yes stop_codon:yes gene_type:complete